MSNIKSLVKDIMSVIFNVPSELIPDDITFGGVEYWDSVAQINLIIGIEEEFNINLSDEDVEDMLSLDLIVNIINSKKNS